MEISIYGIECHITPSDQGNFKTGDLLWMTSGQFARLSKCMQWEGEALNCNSLLARTLHCKVNPMFSGEKQQILNFLSLTRLFSTVQSVPKHSAVVPSRISVLSLTRKLISSFFALIHSSLCTAPAYPSPLPIVFWHPWPYPLIQTSKRISQKLNDP